MGESGVGVGRAVLPVAVIPSAGGAVEVVFHSRGIGGGHRGHGDGESADGCRGARPDRRIQVGRNHILSARIDEGHRNRLVGFGEPARVGHGDLELIGSRSSTENQGAGRGAGAIRREGHRAGTRELGPGEDAVALGKVGRRHAQGGRVGGGVDIRMIGGGRSDALEEERRRRVGVRIDGIEQGLRFLHRAACQVTLGKGLHIRIRSHQGRGTTIRDQDVQQVLMETTPAVRTVDRLHRRGDGIRHQASPHGLQRLVSNVQAEHPVRVRAEGNHVHQLGRHQVDLGRSENLVEVGDSATRGSGRMPRGHFQCVEKQLASDLENEGVHFGPVVGEGATPEDGGDQGRLVELQGIVGIDGKCRPVTGHECRHHGRPVGHLERTAETVGAPWPPRSAHIRHCRSAMKPVGP